STQRVAGERMVVAAGVDILELASFVVAALGIGTLEQEAFDFVGGIQGIAVLLVLFGGKPLQHAANVGGVGFSVLVDDFAENQHFAGPEDISRRPVKGAPVDAEAKIALTLCGETAYG